MLLQTVPIALMHPTHPLFGRFQDIANDRAGHPTQQDYVMAVSIGSHVMQELLKPKHLSFVKK